MEQFNRILAAFLILVVAVGISLFVFSRLGILSKILPSNKPSVTTSTSTQNTSPTPTRTQTPSPTPQAQTGILGWLSRLGKAQNTPTPTVTPTRSPLPTQTQSQTPPSIITQTPQLIEMTPSTNITIVPYGSVSSPTYPASGVETAILPIFGSVFLLGVYLRRLS